MKILFGVPDVNHRELVNLEIDGIKGLNCDCQTIHYGPDQLKRGFLNKIINTVKKAFIIKKALKNNKYDILFLNTAFDFNGVLRDSFTFFILRSQNIKVFLKFHGSDPALLSLDRGFKIWLAKWLLNSVHGVGVLSTEEKEAYTERGFQREKIFVVKNPLNPALYAKDENFRSKLGLDSHSFVFIFCGRFLPFKGLMDVLEALLIVKAKFQNIYLFCIGDGPEMKKARLFVNKNNLNLFVTFTGFIPEIETRYYYENADASILPSSHEGFPMAVFQSMAAGICLITTKITASADYLSEPENVFWVHFQRADEIVESMIKLLTDKDLVTRMKTNNRLKANYFTTEKNALEYMCIFEKLVNN